MKLIATNPMQEHYDHEGNDIVDPEWTMSRRDLLAFLLIDFPDKATLATLALQHQNNTNLIEALETKFSDCWEGKAFGCVRGCFSASKHTK